MLLNVKCNTAKSNTIKPTSFSLAEAEERIILLEQQNDHLQSTLNRFMKKVDRFIQQETANNVAHLLETRSSSPDTATTTTTYYTHRSSKEIQEQVLTDLHSIKISTERLTSTSSKESDDTDVTIPQCNVSEVITIFKETVFSKLSDYYNAKGKTCVVDRYQNTIVEYIDENKIDATMLSTMDKNNFVKNVAEYIGNKMVIDDHLSLEKSLTSLFLIVKSSLELQRMDNNNQLRIQNNAESLIMTDNQTDHLCTKQNSQNSYVILWKIRNVTQFISVATGNYYANKPSILDIATNKIKFNFAIYPSGRGWLQKNFVQCVMFLSGLPQNIENVTLSLHILLVTKGSEIKREFTGVKKFSKADNCIGWNKYTLPLSVIRTQHRMGCKEFVFQCNIKPVSYTDVNGKIEKLKN